MSGLDHLLAKSLESTLRDNLGKKTVKKVEDRLFTKHGISLTQAMEQFHKIDAVLREFFGAGADGLEGKFLQNICKVKQKSKEKNWFTITDSKIIQAILESYGDDDKACILNCVSSEPKITADILKHCKIPQTSGCRKINSLIDNGLLVTEGYIVASDGRKVNKYRTVFDNVRINIESKITVDVQLNRPNYNESSVLQVVYAT